MKDYCPLCNEGNKGDKPGEVDEVEFAQYHSIIIGRFSKEHKGQTITPEMIEKVTHEKELERIKKQLEKSKKKT